MIQPVEDEKNFLVTGCRVHDLVLDMVCLLSQEDNFVTVLDTHGQNIYGPRNARRLAIQKRVVWKDEFTANITPQLRSLSAISCYILVMPSLSSFGALRVLAMEGCSFMRECSYHLNHLESLVQLRYLGLRDIPVDELPEDIGKLKFLQTLKLEFTRIKELPKSIVLLSQLKCFVLNSYEMRGPEGLHLLGKLTSLEELRFTTRCTKILEELGKLTELRKLEMRIYCDVYLYETTVKKLVESLGKLQKIQVLDLFANCVSIGSEDWKVYVPHRKLFVLSLMMKNDMLPVWIKPSLIPYLTRLSLTLDVVKARDMEILGSFQELVSLKLGSSQHILPDFMAGDGAGLFPKLRYFSTPAPLKFLQGAMPILEHVVFTFIQVGWLKSRDDNFVFEFGSLGNLPSLQMVEAHINCWWASEEDVDEAKDALELGTNTHPNRPSLEIKIMHFQC
uniref:Uncharacterized protein n=1 Tax=Avena sativa TaxID=4498 RepID=A0ACD5Z530_AVESA